MVWVLVGGGRGGGCLVCEQNSKVMTLRIKINKNMKKRWRGGDVFAVVFILNRYNIKNYSGENSYR